MNMRLTNMIGKSRSVAQLYSNWPTALLDRSRLIPRRPLLYNLRNGIRFHVQGRSFDVQVINEIWIDKIYTPSPQFSIRDGWIVADIGGQKGIFAVLAATSARGVKVFTFEPAPDSLATLRRNVALNGLSNVTIFGVAVSSKDGEAQLHLAADSGCNSLIQRSDVSIRDDVKVETWSMERVLKTIPHPVNLLKMDIEGMEYETLLSCPAAYLQHVERIALEYHDSSIQTGSHTSELVSFLDSNGFSMRLWPDRRILFAGRIGCV